jgi:tetratricopeptide (TPR) repeat protein
VADQRVTRRGPRNEPEPQDARGYNERGNRYSRTGIYGKAIADYTSAIELDSTFAEAYFNRGGSYYEVGRYEDAIADLSKAIQLDPRDDRFYGWRSVAYLFNDQPDLAQADQDICEELRSRSAEEPSEGV